MPGTDLTIPGESAVVTAGGSGIGLEIASRLAGAGVDTVVNDVDESALDDAVAGLAEQPGTVRGVAGDASDPDAVDDLVATAVDAHGGLDILVNNVGVAGPTKACEEITFEEFMGTLEVNLGGYFNATRAAIPHLRESDAGRIVNVSSMSGKRPLADRTPYTTAKMGVIGFTRTLAVELGGDGVTVNAICPGYVAGPRLEAVIEGQAASQDRAIEDVEREFRSNSPMGEFVEEGDVADAVCYLCSTRAAHVTGEDLNVSAGVCMY